jgi:hypothetical protein
MEIRLEVAVFCAGQTLKSHFDGDAISAALLQDGMQRLVNVTDKVDGQHQSFCPLLTRAAAQILSQPVKLRYNAIPLHRIRFAVAVGSVIITINWNIREMPVRAGWP